MKRYVWILSALVSLHGCSFMRPVPVVNPPAFDKDNHRTVPDYQLGGLVPAKNITEAIENLKIYGDSYQKTANSLRGVEYNASDVTFGGGVIGVVGGLTQSVTTALAGAVLASGASMTSQRYQAQVQAVNYEKASDTMYCMYDELYPVEGGNVEYKFVTEMINKVRRTLDKAQAHIQLVTPDLSKLERSIAKVSEDREAVSSAKHNLTMAAVGEGTADAQAKLNTMQVELIKSTLEKCVAAL